MPLPSRRVLARPTRRLALAPPTPYFPPFSVTCACACAAAPRAPARAPPPAPHPRHVTERSFLRRNPPESVKKPLQPHPRTTPTDPRCHRASSRWVVRVLMDSWSIFPSESLRSPQEPSDPLRFSSGPLRSLRFPSDPLRTPQDPSSSLRSLQVPSGLLRLPQGHLRSTHCFPPSSYSCLEIHICWKVPCGRFGAILRGPAWGDPPAPHGAPDSPARPGWSPRSRD